MNKMALNCAMLCGLMASVAWAEPTTNLPVAQITPGPLNQPVPVSAPATVEGLTLDLGPGVKMDLVWISPGEFMMGSPAGEIGRHDNEGPQHRVSISKGFWMGKCDVTQGQWERVMESNPSYFKNSGANAPVEYVSWNACQEFLKKLNQRSDIKDREIHARLPTEAEWEYACRAGTTTRFNTGDGDADLDRAGWYVGNSDRKTHPVGEKQANAWGLYDMHGNVWEWCQDWYGNYDAGASTDPAGPASGACRVLRGGAWTYVAGDCRSAYRGNSVPEGSGWVSGFRVVVSR